jgi:hypothetical protein
MIVKESKISKLNIVKYTQTYWLYYRPPAELEKEGYGQVKVFAHEYDYDN